MILPIAIALSIGVALLRGGRFTYLQGWTFRYGWLVLVALAIQIGIVYLPRSLGVGLGGLRVWLLAGSHLLLIAVVALNLRMPGLWLIAVGLGLNLAVMLANGGYMPVTPEVLARAGLAHLAPGGVGSHVLGAKDILLTKATTRLWVLSDIMAIPRVLRLRCAFSIGDLLLSLGAFVLFQQTMRRPRAATAAAASEKNAG
jgi:hypothetical protein